MIGVVQFSAANEKIIMDILPNGLINYKTFLYGTLAVICSKLGKEYSSIDAVTRVEHGQLFVIFSLRDNTSTLDLLFSLANTQLVKVQRFSCLNEFFEQRKNEPTSETSPCTPQRKIDANPLFLSPFIKVEKRENEPSSDERNIIETNINSDKPVPPARRQNLLLTGSDTPRSESSEIDKEQDDTKLQDITTSSMNSTLASQNDTANSIIEAADISQSEVSTPGAKDSPSQQEESFSVGGTPSKSSRKRKYPEEGNCQKCNISLKSNQYISQFIKSAISHSKLHSNKKAFCCNTCDFKCNRRFQMIKHQERTCHRTYKDKNDDHHYKAEAKRLFKECFPLLAEKHESNKSR